jgi:beta-phosphoglucomutase-like phosphatase (HAD superfamily)
MDFVKNKYELILFDLDGTLTDSFTLISESIYRTLQHFGFDYTLEYVKKSIASTSLIGEYKRIIGKEMTEEEFNPMKLAHRKKQAELLKDYLKLWPEVKECFVIIIFIVVIDM